MRCLRPSYQRSICVWSSEFYCRRNTEGDAVCVPLSVALLLAYFFFAAFFAAFFAGFFAAFLVAIFLFSLFVYGNEKCRSERMYRVPQKECQEKNEELSKLLFQL